LLVCLPSLTAVSAAWTGVLAPDVTFIAAMNGCVQDGLPTVGSVRKTA
jgi:hypothetical protein